MRIIAFSDLHIPFTNRYFLDFIKVVPAKADLVVIVGDIFDLIRCSEKDIKKSKIGRELINSLETLMFKVRTILIKGNHDPELEKIAPKFFKFAYEKSLLDVREKFIIENYLFIHGHQFDSVCKRIKWKWLKKIMPFFFRTPSEWKVRKREKWKKHIASIYSNCYTFLEKNRNLNLVIGHTHYASKHIIETKQFLIDCGDFWDSCSWTEIDLKLKNATIRRWKIQ